MITAQQAGFVSFSVLYPTLNKIMGNRKKVAS